MKIDNPETIELIRELAKLTGETFTVATRKAVRERLERVRGRTGMAERLLKIGKECAPLFKEPYRSIDHGELLYDDKGLPK
jgi:antitoxin VapB